jgi:hypothetical protein
MSIGRFARTSSQGGTALNRKRYCTSCPEYCIYRDQYCIFARRLIENTYRCTLFAMAGRHVDSTCLGRTELISAIVEALASGSHCVLSGPEGIGISTVLAQVSNRLVAQGQRPTLIRSVQPQRAFSALDPVTGGVPPEQRFDALVAQLHERSDPTRTRLPVVIIDDAHWIDDESAGVILQAVLSGAARLIVATRDETALPLPLERVITMSDTRHYYVAPLQTGDMTALLSSLLAGHIEQRTVNTLIRTSAGNPAHLRALVLGSTAAGTLAAFRDTWRLTGPMHCTGAMAAVLYRSVEDLGAGPRDALDTLALTSGLDVELARQFFCLATPLHPTPFSGTFAAKSTSIRPS